MISSSDSDRRLIDRGYLIAQAVVEEGRRKGVFAYLYHWQDVRGEWHARFETYDRTTGEVSCRLSPELIARIRANADAVRAYARKCEEQMNERPAAVCRRGPTAREIAREIARARVARLAAVGEAPGVGSDDSKINPNRNRQGERTELTNEKREEMKP